MVNEPVTARYRRRELLGAGVGGVVAASLGGAYWADLLSAQEPRVRRGRGYGPLGPADPLGLRLPPGFRARLIARGGQPVAGTGYLWHEESDGAAVFPTADGFVLVSNSEARRGGASAIRFDATGGILDAYRILGGTRRNCSGGGTPWGTWLSCEESRGGLVWECDPSGRKPAVARPAMGAFVHEAAAVDARHHCVYLTEDVEDGGLYRFRPRRWPDLSRGALEVALVRRRGRVDWKQVPDPAAKRRLVRRQVPGAARFARAEGIWLDGTVVYVATTGDSRIHGYDTVSRRLRTLYDGERMREPLLKRVDAIVASSGGELFVCDDRNAAELDVGLITRDREVSRFMSAGGRRHRDSELTGLAFDPSGSRLFLASQRAAGVGEVYEVTGPFTV